MARSATKRTTPAKPTRLNELCEGTIICPMRCFLRLLSLVLQVSLLLPVTGNSKPVRAGQTDHAPAAAPQQLAESALMADRAGRSTEAIGLYRRALAGNPQWSIGWKNLGTLLADEGDYVAAQEALKNLVKLEPRNGDAWILLGVCDFKMGKYDDAVSHLEKARAFHISSRALVSVLYYYSASVMILQGDFDSARKRLLLLAYQDVSTDALMEAYGLATLRIKVLPGKEAPDVQAVVLEVGRFASTTTHLKVSEARDGFERLLAKYPAQLGLHYAYGEYLSAHQLFPEACDQFAREATLAPMDPMPRVQIAAIKSQELDQVVKALPLAEEAVKLAPSSFAARFVLGKILLKLGKYNEAAAELETAEKEAPDSIAVHALLRQAYQRIGRTADAKREAHTLQKLQEFEASMKGEGSDETSTSP